MPAEPDEAMTVPRAAAIAGVTIPRMQQLLRSGKIAGWREGRQWKTTRQAVEAYLWQRCDRRAVAGNDSWPDTA